MTFNRVVRDVGLEVNSGRRGEDRISAFKHMLNYPCHSNRFQASHLGKVQDNSVPASTLSHVHTFTCVKMTLRPIAMSTEMPSGAGSNQYKYENSG